jgi:hypothetical protein
MKFAFGLAFALILAFSASSAAAQPSKCSAPPYGGSAAHYRAFIKDFGRLLDNPARMLSAICRAKFEGADRTPLYNLGFTDSEIDGEETSDFAVKMIAALKNLSAGRP